LHDNGSLMEKIIPTYLQPIIFGSSDSTLSKQISQLEKSGKIRKIAPKIYTGNFEDTPEEIISANILQIIGNQYPGALLSHRSALEFKPTKTGHIFITYKYSKKIKLPGVTISFLEGKGAIEGDRKFVGALYVSQRERALLENLQISKKPGSESKTLTLPEIEDYLEKIIRVNGEEEINRVRNKAREIAQQLDMLKEFEKLNALISALLTTHPSKILSSPLAQARAFGIPYDEARIQLFEKLFQELNSREFIQRPEKNNSRTAFKNFAFFESYFSNYIEGTRFEIDEAKQIIETQKPLPARNEDSHDVLGTYQIVSSKKEMEVIPRSANELLQILQYRHKILLSARLDKTPGVFKDKNNFAGSTAFVDVILVRGTLLKGYEYYRALNQPLARAVYMMFFISEIHPFLDGNGRIARVMMNAELVKQGQAKIIIPTVYREDYLGAIRRLTRQRDPDALIRMLQRVHEFSENIYDDDMDAMQAYLESCHAFDEPENGKLKIIVRD